MAEKQKARILYPPWLTKKQTMMLRLAEKSKLHPELVKKFEKAMDPSTPIPFPDTPEIRFALFLEKELGFFGLILLSRFLDYGRYSKAEAEKNSLWKMAQYAAMRK